MAAAALATAAMALVSVFPPPELSPRDQWRLLPLPLPDAPLHLGSVITGSPLAPVGILLFTDLSCSACAMVARETMPRLRQLANDGQVALGVRFVPREDAPHAAAVTAAVCASEAGRFLEVHDALFALGTGVAPREWEVTVRRLRLQDPGIERCLSESAETAGEHNIASADDVKLRVRPTMFIGRMQAGWMFQPFYRIHGYVEPSYLESIIASARQEP